MLIRKVSREKKTMAQEKEEINAAVMLEHTGGVGIQGPSRGVGVSEQDSATTVPGENTACMGTDASM